MLYEVITHDDERLGYGVELGHEHQEYQEKGSYNFV